LSIQEMLDDHPALPFSNPNSSSPFTLGPFGLFALTSHGFLKTMG
jgi:hypothetical protein